ncbi:MAG: DNA repair protein RadC [Saprospiraceae bacterium]|nr:DNA repair protein RadC [Saprospiraceae bacterium]
MLSTGNNYKNPISIKTWAEDDRPREKLMLKGKQAMSDAELLAIIIGSGSRSESAVTLSQKILSYYKNNLNELAKCTMEELMSNFKGMGQAKSLSVIACLELGRRRQSAQIHEKPTITSSQDVYNIIAPTLRDLRIEEFWILCLNRANRMTHKFKISAGGVSGTVVDAKVVFHKAIESLASSIVLVHNHPSGNDQPSNNDINLTKQLKQAGEALDIHIIDHVIIADNKYYSFADKGML